MKTDRYTICVGWNDSETGKRKPVLAVHDEVDSYLVRNILK